MRRSAILLIVALTTVALGVPAAGAKPAAAPPPAATVWLCRPGTADNPYTQRRAATLVSGTGRTRVQLAPARRRPRFDCFYVYPTVSTQPGMNANLDKDVTEIGVARIQASRFSQVCRMYAPMYRQLTRHAIATGISAAGAALAYTDVRNAWLDYLAHDNHGRGVVLIGHSQGTAMLIPLIQHEIDPKPKVRARLVSALLIGGNVVVPAGKDVGGDFRHIPACRRPRQTGCVVAYSTFDHVPPANAAFGRVGQGVSGSFRKLPPGPMRILCTNPAALRGGRATLHPYFPAQVQFGGLSGPLPPRVTAKVHTPWVGYPDFVRARCRNSDGAQWLQVDEHRRPADVRPRLTENLGPGWGLHLIDVNLALGDLVHLAGTQGASWVAHHSR